MIAVMGLIQTATNLTDRMMADTAAAISAAPGEEVRGRVFNRVIDRTQKGISYARGSVELDAITQFFFDDISSSMSAASSGGFNLAMGLSGPLVADLNPIVCLQNTVVAPTEPYGGLKRMSILRKRPDVSAERFQEEWLGLHAVLVKRLKGLRGYRQNLVLDGPRDAEGHMMVDGMVELWFGDGAAIEAAFASGAGDTTMTHAKEFIGEISTFLVDPMLFGGVS